MTSAPVPLAWDKWDWLCVIGVVFAAAGFVAAFIYGPLGVLFPIGMTAIWRAARQSHVHDRKQL